MAKPKKIEPELEIEPKEKEGANSCDILSSVMSDKENKGFHLNGHKEIYYKVPFKCLDLDDLTGGGLEPGVHRFIGPSEGGKSSLCFDIIRNFLDDGKKNKIKRKAFVINAEGKQPKELEQRTGLKIVRTPEEWVEGTVFVLESNIFEFIFTVIRRLINTNPDNCQFIFMIDSLDALTTKDDSEKGFSEHEKVAGGPLLSKRFLTNMTLRLTKLGHICLITSQVSASIKTKYDQPDQMILNAAGGNAAIHYCTTIFEFKPTTSKQEYTYLTGKHNNKLSSYENPITGKEVTIYIRKSTIQTSGETAKYPIKHNIYGKSAVWMEKDLVSKLKSSKLLQAKGAWLAFDENLLEELRGEKIEVLDQYQGESKFIDALEANSELTNILYGKVLSWMKYKRDMRKSYESDDSMEAETQSKSETDEEIILV